MKIAHWTHEWAIAQNLVCIYQDVIASTNTHAKMFNNSKDSVIVTDFQPQGRGRGENTWVATKKGTSLLSSWVFLKEYAPQPIFSPLVGLAVYSALNAVFKLKDLSLKAPNDIYIQDKKLGGILIEIETQGVVNKIIVGLGLNILEKPKLKTATYLQAGKKTELTKSKFQEFLSQLYINLDQALIGARGSELSAENRKELLKALNQNPNLKEKFTNILKDGSLVLNKKTISWLDL